MDSPQGSLVSVCRSIFFWFVSFCVRTRSEAMRDLASRRHLSYFLHFTVILFWICIFWSFVYKLCYSVLGFFVCFFFLRVPDVVLLSACLLISFWVCFLMLLQSRPKRPSDLRGNRPVEPEPLALLARPRVNLLLLSSSFLLLSFFFFDS